MEPATTLGCVRELLNAMPGVAVDRSWLADGGAHLRLAIESPASLAVIVYDAMFANAPPITVSLTGEHGPDGERAGASHLRYRLCLAATASEPPTTLEIFGIFLVRRLKAIKLIAPERADELQTRWNAVVM